MAILARRYLQIPATSASSERYFSQGNLNINKLRNRLNKSTFNMIMCLKSWGIINEDIEGEDKKVKKGINIEEDLEETFFGL